MARTDEAISADWRVHPEYGEGSPKEFLEQVAADRGSPLSERLAILLVCCYSKDPFLSPVANSLQGPGCKLSVVIENDDPTFNYVFCDFVEQVLLDAAKHGASSVSVISMDRGPYPKKTLCRTKRGSLEVLGQKDDGERRLFQVLETFAEQNGVELLEADEYWLYPRLAWKPDRQQSEKLASFPTGKLIELIRTGIPLEDIL